MYRDTRYTLKKPILGIVYLCIEHCWSLVFGSDKKNDSNLCVSFFKLFFVLERKSRGDWFWSGVWRLKTLMVCKLLWSIKGCKHWFSNYWIFCDAQAVVFIVLLRVGLLCTQRFYGCCEASRGWNFTTRNADVRRLGVLETGYMEVFCGRYAASWGQFSV